MRVIVSYSGGKDSQAALIWAYKNFDRDLISVIFCDTGWEHDITYQHLKTTTELMGIDLIVLKSKKYANFIDLSVKKKRFPSTKARFCTEELKVKPTIDYILEQEDDLLIIQGIRRDESNARSKMMQHCNYFKYYFQPYKHDENGKPVMHTYRAKAVRKWKEKYADEILRPCFEWTAQQTIDYIIENGMNPNPLYKKGMSRVGCMPCVMCKHGEIKKIAENMPEVIDKIRAAETESGHTLFPSHYIPDRFVRTRDKKGKYLPFIDDVVRYVTDNPDQISMIEEINDSDRCMSIYNLCE